MDGTLFFNGWPAVVRTVLVGALAYVALIALLRVSGKRTLSKMNAFDFVVTVALGSTLATILLSREVALVEGLTALGLLIGMQFVITWLSVRSSRIGSLVKAEPVLVASRGVLLHGAMRRERVTREEILSVVRQHGLASLDEVEAVVLETEGSFSCIRRAEYPGRSALTGLDKIDESVESGGSGR